ncbi:MAG: glycoside hydrolase family 140 protein [Bacteroidales bacterium]
MWRLPGDGNMCNCLCCSQVYAGSNNQLKEFELITRAHCLIICLLLCISCNTATNTGLCPELRISENGRFLMSRTGEPFFWLGDTGWLLFTKLSREEAEIYFQDRSEKGFNVIQAMVLHDVRRAVNVYGDSALQSNDTGRPFTTPGSSADNPSEYDYWDHVDYLIDLAGEKGLYVALVPVWGSNVRNGSVTRESAGAYASWLAERYKNCSNVIWLNGGDVRGSDSTAIWQLIGSSIRRINPGQLITFHPFGRTQSSTWFHDEGWLDFNMFQSGHRRYDQDTAGLAYGEDNWKYAPHDYARIPVKPILDSEPSYEGIPQGLHDPAQPYWTDSDVRRYAYWSVFAGCCGFTYGHNAIMQFHKEGDPEPAYGVKETWDAALNAPGASQMKYLRDLILSKPYFDRIPSQDLIAGIQGERYDYIVATRGKDYAFIYTFNGRVIIIDAGRMNLSRIKASWYNPRNGEYIRIGTFRGTGTQSFDPPGEISNGNDWVLVLEKNGR